MNCNGIDIAPEKERADQQSILRWTMASASDTRQTRPAAAMQAGRDRRLSNRKLQKEARTQKMEEREEKIMKNDSSFAALANNR
jgi:hypothetical protein